MACAALMLSHSAIAVSYAEGRSAYSGSGALGVGGERL